MLVECDKVGKPIIFYESNLPLSRTLFVHVIIIILFPAELAIKTPYTAPQNNNNNQIYKFIVRRSANIVTF